MKISLFRFSLQFKIAFRNLLNHRLRTVLSIFMIAGAVFSIVSFHGLTDFFYAAIKNIVAEIQYGNIQVANKKHWEPGKESRSDRLFKLDDIKELKLDSDNIEKISGRLSFYGLITNGENSIGARIIGIDLDSEPNFFKNVKISEGAFFANNANQIIVGKLLAKQMDAKIGEDVSILTNTLDGVMNALDLKLVGSFASGLEEIDSQVIYAPLHIAQSILDTDKVEIGILKLKNLTAAEKYTRVLNDVFEKKQANLYAKSWRELSFLYRQVEKFYSVQNRVVEIILNLLMFFGILNSVSMSIVERTGEIGTLRSLGETRRSLIIQFLTETFILVILGTILGTIMSVSMSALATLIGLSVTLPMATLPIAIRFNFLWSAVLYAGGLVGVTSMIATYIPIKRATKMNIVDALRENV